jgi:hypothetical protein
MRSRLPGSWFSIVTFMTLSACSAQVANWKQLETRNERAAGVVVNVDCNNHGKVSYRFTVNERQITNSSYGYSERPCSSMKAGDPITIYYDPEEPGTTNTPMTPSAAVCFYEARAMTPFWFVGFLLLAGAIRVFRKGNPFKPPVARDDEL